MKTNIFIRLQHYFLCYRDGKPFQSTWIIHVSGCRTKTTRNDNFGYYKRS